MKRVLLALAAGTVVVLGYALTLAGIVVFTRKYWLISYLGLPLSLPKTVFFHFFPPIAEDFSYRLTGRRMIIAVVAFGMNFLLYSIPFYILLTFIARRRRQVAAPQPAPPLPPSFDS